MSKQEFLHRLRETLTGEVPGNVVEENIRFYDEYISTEVRNGATEEGVTASIGDPRLIAKTIIDANENAKDTSYSGESQTVYEENMDTGRKIHYMDLSKWYWKLLAAVAFVLFFFVIASILTGIFSLLIPLMGPFLLVLLILWIIRGIRR